MRLNLIEQAYLNNKTCAIYMKGLPGAMSASAPQRNQTVFIPSNVQEKPPPWNPPAYYFPEIFFKVVRIFGVVRTFYSRNVSADFALPATSRFGKQTEVQPVGYQTFLTFPILFSSAGSQVGRIHFENQHSDRHEIQECFERRR